MRHFLLQAPAIAALAVSVVVAPLPGRLVAPGRSPPGCGTGQTGATVKAVQIATITGTANHDLTVAAGTVVESG